MKETKLTEKQFKADLTRINASHIKFGPKIDGKELLLKSYLEEEVEGDRKACVYAKELTLQLAAKDVENVAPMNSIFFGSDGQIRGLVLENHQNGSLRNFLDGVARMSRVRSGEESSLHECYTPDQMREIVNGIKDITRTLTALHEMRIFHLDVDEFNIVRTYSDNNNKEYRSRWKLIDFGAARTTRMDLLGAYLSNYKLESPLPEELDTLDIWTRQSFGHADKLPPEAKSNHLRRNGPNKVVLVRVDGGKVDVFHLVRCLFPSGSFDRSIPDFNTQFERAFKTRAKKFTGAHFMSLLDKAKRKDGSGNFWVRVLPGLLERRPEERMLMADFHKLLEAEELEKLIYDMLFE